MGTVFPWSRWGFARENFLVIFLAVPAPVGCACLRLALLLPQHWRMQEKCLQALGKYHCEMISPDCCLYGAVAAAFSCGDASVGNHRYL